MLILEEKLEDKDAEIQRLRRKLQQQKGMDMVEEKTVVAVADNKDVNDDEVTMSMEAENDKA